MDKERNWTFIMYPESMPKDWKDYLQQTGLKIAISPLHDRDVNEATGEIKKPHYHVLLIFEGPTTYRRVERLVAYLNGTIPKRVISVVGILRYLTHKDNPEKAQYDEREITTLGGLDPSSIDSLSESQIDQYTKEIMEIIKANKINEYAWLMDYLRKENLNELFRLARKNTIFYNSYLKSKKELTKDVEKIIMEAR